MKDQQQQTVQSRSNAGTVSSRAAIGFPSVVQRAAAKTIAITLEKQQKRNWCWAAVCQLFTGKSQKTLADTYTSGYKENGPGKYEDPYTVLGKEGKTVAVTATSQPDWSTMVNLIDGGKTPVCKVGSHYIIICGYKGNDGISSGRRYIYKDPADGDQLQEATEDTVKDMNGGFEGYYTIS